MQQPAPHDNPGNRKAPQSAKQEPVPIPMLVQEMGSRETAPAAPLLTRKRTASVVSDEGAIYHVATAPKAGRQSWRRFALALAATLAVVGVIAVLGTGFAPSAPMGDSAADPGGTHQSIAAGLQATAKAQGLPTIAAPRSVAAPDVRTDGTAERLVRTEAALHTGEIGATVDFGNGMRTVTDVRFDFGSDGRAARFQIMRTYGGAMGTHTQELIAIGDRTWQRVDEGGWTIVSVPIAVREQVRALLPDVNGATNFAAAGQNREDAFRWSNVNRNADVTLTVDGATGIPQRLHQVTHPTGATLSATYTGWNTAVDVRPPA